MIQSIGHAIAEYVVNRRDPGAIGKTSEALESGLGAAQLSITQSITHCATYESQAIFVFSAFGEAAALVAGCFPEQQLGDLRTALKETAVLTYAPAHRLVPRLLMASMCIGIDDLPEDVRAFETELLNQGVA